MARIEQREIGCEEVQPSNRVVAEGKTKIIYDTAFPSYVRIRSKDEITAGDGAKRDRIENKATYATQTTVNCFRLLEAYGIPTHFLDKCSDTEFLARRATMVPLECVARRVATGSYLKRNPDVVEGNRFDNLQLEFFHKDDANHDPMVEFNGEQWDKFDPKLPKEKGHLETLPGGWLGLSETDVQNMQEMTARVFEILESAWAAQGVMLVDLKIEFGRDKEGRLIVADVIDNDSWRIWPGGNKGQMLDKQIYRNLVEKPTAEQLAEIRGNYQTVAEMTQRFR
jgi:phosphoribosylaminoimidazole-succinocarboxamide synthase